ncbi:hypothetical protein PT974_08624 [Cladobotryum mycophilum]|uniref:Uncharacterized protein n=1 Tax=Cladobotryum mycophilum TaxID=491253 RepID=A0ABR0SDT8_9HYPO
MNTADPGAHQLAEASDSEDQFMDAQSIPGSPNLGSPVPKTRVEKVDGEPSYGEVPGTDAYKMRENDAEPDEIAVIADPEAKSTTPTPQEPIPVPTTIVEESIGEHPGQHSVEVEDKHQADALPDILLGPDGEIKGGSRANSPGLPPTINSGDDLHNDDDDDDNANDDDNDNDDAEGDDFGDGFDDDFDEFEEGQSAPAMPVPPPLQQNTLPFSIPDFDGLSPDEVISTIEPCLANLFPSEELDFPSFPPLSKESVFLTQRSASLWSQLVAPPPLAPPDWIRSRTRRLFLVSLGVPVDLDEILPASKQKKLILPSLNVPSTSPRSSSDVRNASKLKQGENNTSTASADEQERQSASKKRKGPPPEPDLDLVSARHLCQTTDEALDGMTNQELKEHVAKLEAMEGTAKEVLDYWTKRTDEKIGDREAFEGVIENLVAHARKVRK